MAPRRNDRSRTVEARGAAAGGVLHGIGWHNQGLRLRVLQDQPGGDGGPIKGGFVILDAGDNIHAHRLELLAGRVTTADEVLCILRRDSPNCVNVVNANILASGEAPGAQKLPTAD